MTGVKTKEPDHPETTYCAGPLYIGEDEAKAVQAVALKLEVSQVIAEKMVMDFKAELLKTPWAADLKVASEIKRIK